MDYAALNLNSAERRALWQEQEERVRAHLEQIQEEVFEGQAAIKNDYVSRFSGLAKPNLALGTTTDLAGFVAVCVSPKKPDKLRVVASNGHTASRYDANPDALGEALMKALRRWLAQPMYRQSGVT